MLPLLKSDLLTIMQAVTNETLADTEVIFDTGSACCVVMASGGYPGSYEKGKVITIPDDLQDSVYVAGASLTDNTLTTSGGRVLNVTSTAPTLREAIDTAYTKVERIHFDGAHFRHDIGQRALQALDA